MLAGLYIQLILPRGVLLGRRKVCRFVFPKVCVYTPYTPKNLCFLMANGIKECNLKLFFVPPESAVIFVWLFSKISCTLTPPTLTHAGTPGSDDKRYQIEYRKMDAIRNGGKH